MKTKHRSCPFCGTREEGLTIHALHFRACVKCMKCGASGPYYLSSTVIQQGSIPGFIVDEVWRLWDGRAVLMEGIG